jgi:iron complex transport system substrate-binding protein
LAKYGSSLGIYSKIGLSLSLLASPVMLAGYAADRKADDRKTASRVVSFAPSNTELLYAIGAGDKIIGVCSYCDYPGQVHGKTQVGNFISANLERLTRLKPDKIVLVSGQEALSSMLSHNGYHVEVLKNEHLSDIARNIKSLALLTDNTIGGDKVARSFDKSIADLQSITLDEAHPTVFYCVWPQPLLTVGKSSYLTEVITACGGKSIADNLTAAYPHYSMERLVLANPDLIVMPYECKDHEFLKKHPWSSLKAVKNNRVYFLPDPKHDGLARPTLRLTSGMLWLAKRIHPALTDRLDSWYSHSSSVY